MRLAVLRCALSCLQAALVLAAPASTVHNAVPRVQCPREKASPDHRPDAFITGVDDKGNNGAIEVSVLRPICPQNISSASRGTAVEDLERRVE